MVWAGGERALSEEGVSSERGGSGGERRHERPPGRRALEITEAGTAFIPSVRPGAAARHCARCGFPDRTHRLSRTCATDQVVAMP